MPKGKGGASGGAHGKGSGKTKDAPSEGAKGGKKSGAGTAVKVSWFNLSCHQAYMRSYDQYTNISGEIEKACYKKPVE